MPCQMCGGRAKGRFCRKCERDRRYGNYQTAANLAKEERDGTPVECTNCGETYHTADDEACPECGGRRRRYAGTLPGHTCDLCKRTHATLQKAMQCCSERLEAIATDGGKTICPCCEKESEKVYRCTNDDCPKGSFVGTGGGSQKVRRRS